MTATRWPVAPLKLRHLAVDREQVPMKDDKLLLSLTVAVGLLAFGYSIYLLYFHFRLNEAFDASLCFAKG